MLKAEVIVIIVFPILLGLIGIILLQIGLIIQKNGLHLLFTNQTFHFAKESLINLFTTKSFFSWLFGTFIAFCGAFLGFYAISISEVTIIQPLVGLGPIILILLLTIFFDYHFNIFQWISIGMSTIGVVFLAIPEQNYQTVTNIVNQGVIVNISIVSMLIVVIIGYLQYAFKIFKVCIFECVIAGILGALPSLYAKIAMPELIDSFNIFHWSIIALVLSQLFAFIIFQRGIHKGNFPTVASIFTALTILIPVIIASLWMSEQIDLIQAIGIIMIIVGAISLYQEDFKSDSALENVIGELSIKIAE